MVDVFYWTLEILNVQHTYLAVKRNLTETLIINFYGTFSIALINFIFHNVFHDTLISDCKWILYRVIIAKIFFK